MTPPTDADIEFDCPLCDGAFEAPAELLGQEVECPHCGQVVELPDTVGIEQHTQEQAVQEPTPAGHPASEAPQETSARPEPLETQPQPAPEPQNPLSREERAAARKRFNLVLAVAGGLILVLVFVLLANFG